MPIAQNYVNQPSGSRRLSLMMLSARDRANEFSGVPQGSGKPFRYLAAFQEAEPYLGLPPQAYKLVAWLVKQTMPQDWEEGSRPICWPSAARQGEYLALSPARVKILNRALFEAGIFVIRDSETGKRYGRRDGSKRIIEAFGFDLSPLAYRFDEFIRIAAEAKLEREKVRMLRKRATRSRRSIFQVGETLAAMGPLPAEWSPLAIETAGLVASLRTLSLSQDLALVVMSLESRQSQAEALLRQFSETVDTNPEGLASEPHNKYTNLTLNPKDTVIARRERSSAEGPAPHNQPEIQEVKQTPEENPTFTPFEKVEKLDAAELIELAPRLAELIDGKYPKWADVIDAAGTWLRADLGVSQPLWGEACRVLGRQMATVALAIVSTKPKDHFSRGAGGYFAAMVKRAQCGELHLDCSLWKLRREKWGGIKRSASRA